MKCCSNCKAYKPLEDFAKRAASKDGFQYRCRSCDTIVCNRWRLENPARVKEYSKEWYLENADFARAKTQAWRDNNPRKASEQKKKWCLENREQSLLHRRNSFHRRYKKDPQFTAICAARSRIHGALFGARKSASTDELVGGIENYVRHIESKFTPEMTWKNFGGVWEIHHIKPIHTFDMTDPEQQKLACHFSNVEPLTIAEHNLRHGGKP